MSDRRDAPHGHAEQEPHREGGGYGRKILVGLVLIGAAFVCLWLGSPPRNGGATIPTFLWIFNLLFALGFIVGSMGLMGAERDYPAFLSGLVLYFIVGVLVALFLYVQGNQVSLLSLNDAASPAFWMAWLRVAALWPSYLVTWAGLFDYTLFDWVQTSRLGPGIGWSA